MQALFHHLLFSNKTKRWLVLLETIEEKEQVIAQTLIEQTGFGRRTIIDDMKALKAYFGATIHLFSNEQGYHFSFCDPKGYYERKQALLAEEKVFLFVDQLAAGKCLGNKQWSETLGVSSAGFQRIKGHLQTVLIKHYGLTLESKTNRLCGEEAGIRQFLYDFYFTLPLYPAALQDHVDQIHQEQVPIQEGPWQMDPTLFNQWLKITKLRVDQGYCLPDSPRYKDLQTALVQASDQQMNVALPEPEKAALFLLSLEERQFLNPMTQKAFVCEFSPTKVPYFLARETKGLTYRLFDTLIFLMEMFFQLPRLEEVSQENQTKDVLLATLMKQFSTQKKRYRNTIAVSYHLTGPTALKRWIKTTLEAVGRDKGVQIVEAPLVNSPGIVRHLKVANQGQTLPPSGGIDLPTFPGKEAIEQTAAPYL